MTPNGRWADLRVRGTSAAVLIAVGGVAVFSGGAVFLIAVMALVGAMIWELAGMTAAKPGLTPLILGVLAGICLFLWTAMLSPVVGFGLLFVPSLGLMLTNRRDRVLLAVYALAVMLAGTGFLLLRANGLGLFLWLVLIVVVCDSLGYFAGRLIGGPKFWPRVSPKKTWSGTVAGWVGAGVVGLIFSRYGFPSSLVILSPLVAFAGQLGDIAESWIKRRAGVKDSSNLIPGHGGVLDRFDALTGAMLAVQVLMLFFFGLG